MTTLIGTIASLLAKMLNGPKVVFYLTVALNVAAISIVQLTFDDQVLAKYFSSDTLNLASIYRDIFVNGNSIQGWHLSESPYFFPDMFMYFTLMFITGGDFLIATMLFAMLQFLLLSLLFRSLFVLLLGERAYPFLILCQVIFSLAIFSFITVWHHWNFTFLTMLNGFHMGAGLMALLSLVFSFRFLDKSAMKYLWGIGIINILMIPSDMLYLLYYLLPSLLWVIFLYWKSIQRNLLVLILTNLVTFALGFGLRKWLYGLGIFEVRHQELINFDRVRHSLKITGDIVNGLVVEGGSRSLFFAVVILGTAFSIFGVWKFWSLYKKKGQKGFLYQSILSAFIILVLFAAVFAPVVKGFVFDSSNTRYYMFAFFLSCTGLFVAYSLITLNKPGMVQRFFVLAKLSCILLLIGLTVTFIKYDIANSYRHYFNYKPAIAEEIDHYAREYGLKHGIANYWKAKVITMFSDEGVQVVSVHDQLTPYIHGASEQWYYRTGNEQPPVIDFVVTAAMQDLSYLNEVFSEDEVQRIEGSSIVIIPESYFERQPYAPPIPVTK